MAQDNVDISLVATEAGQTKKALDDVLKKLEKINKLSSFEIGKGDAEIKKLGKTVESLNVKLKKNVSVTKDEVKELKTLKTQSDTTADSMLGIARATAIVTGAIMHFKKSINIIRELDTPMYNLGVVAGFSAEQIEVMKLKLLEFSGDIPQSAAEIADAMDLIMKTGQNYDDAMKIITASSKLATASGSDLNFITDVLSKTLVSFGLKAEVASNSINRFQSAVLNTPLSMEGLARATSNSASSFATLINFTHKSGKELDNYKEQLLNLNIAMAAEFAKLGKMYAQYKFCDMLETHKVA